MREENMKTNVQVNRVADESASTSESTDRNSGSTPCYAICDLRFVQFKQTYWVRLDGKNYYPEKPADHHNIETREVEQIIAVVNPSQVIAITSTYSPKSTMDYCTLILNSGTKIEVPYSIQGVLSLLNSCDTDSGVC